MNDRAKKHPAPITPRVTVLMCVHNGQQFLREAIGSVLSQTFHDFEFLIINDGSTDSSRDIILSYDDPRIRLVENPANIGLTKSLNRGLELANGSLIARQDADDRSHPERLEKQVGFMSDHPDVVLLGSRARIINEQGRVVSSSGPYKAPNHLGITFQILFGNPFVHSSVMFRRELIWEQFHGYNESHYYNQDFELWSRIIAKYKAANLKDALVDSRTSPFSLTKPSPEKNRVFKENFFINIKVQQQNVIQILGRNERFAIWPDLWSRTNNPFIRSIQGHPENPELLLDILATIRTRFNRTYPEAINDKGVHRVASQAYFNLANYLAPLNYKAALRAFCSGAALNYLNGVVLLPEFLLRMLHLEGAGRRLKRLHIDIKNTKVF